MATISVSTIGLQEGILFQVLKPSGLNENRITHYLINKSHDFIPVVDTNNILLEDGLIVIFEYKGVKIKGMSKELTMANIIQKRKSAYKSLLIGVEQYKNSSIPLRGSINGLEKVKKLMLSKLRFKEYEIKILINEQATKQNISLYLERMIKDADKGSSLFLLFEGHGASSNEKGKGSIEGICPWDYDPESQNNMISENEMNKFFQLAAKRNVKLICCLDSCHSGGIAEPVFSSSVSGIGRNVLISACSGGRYAHSKIYPEGPCGILTHTLVETLDSAITGIKKGITLGTLMEDVKTKIDIPGQFDQSPHISGYTGDPISILYSTP